MSRHAFEGNHPGSTLLLSSLAYAFQNSIDFFCLYFEVFFLCTNHPPWGRRFGRPPLLFRLEPIKVSNSHRSSEPPTAIFDRRRPPFANVVQCSPPRGRTTCATWSSTRAARLRAGARLGSCLGRRSLTTARGRRRTTHTARAGSRSTARRPRSHHRRRASTTRTRRPARGVARRKPAARAVTRQAESGRRLQRRSHRRRLDYLRSGQGRQTRGSTRCQKRLCAAAAAHW